MPEKGVLETLRRIRRPIGCVLGAVGLSTTLACDMLKGPGPVVPDYELSINCAQLPADTAKQQVPVDGLQILRLRIAGVDYSEQLRVQIFPESDVNISGINGEAPNEVVRLADLETGRPVIAPLPHGSLTLQQTTEASGGAAAISTPPAAAAREWLSFSLSCAPPAIAVGS